MKRGPQKNTRPSFFDKNLQLLQPEPQPPLLVAQQSSPFLSVRADLSMKPAPMADSMKSMFIGFTSSKSPLSITNFTPCSVKISSLSLGPSRAMPNVGPDQPPSVIIILTDCGSLPSRSLLITSPAFSVTSNIDSPFLRTWGTDNRCRVH